MGGADAVGTSITGSVENSLTATTLATVVGMDAVRGEMSPDGAGATTGETTTIVGEITAGAIAVPQTTIGGNVASPTTATEIAAGVIGGMTVDGETLVSVTMTGAIVLVVEFNIGIAGDRFCPIYGTQIV